jgi:hypothetical protein
VIKQADSSVSVAVDFLRALQHMDDDASPPQSHELGAFYFCSTIASLDAAC